MRARYLIGNNSFWGLVTVVPPSLVLQIIFLHHRDRTLMTDCVSTALFWVTNLLHTCMRSAFLSKSHTTLGHQKYRGKKIMVPCSYKAWKSILQHWQSGHFLAHSPCENAFHPIISLREVYIPYICPKTKVAFPDANVRSSKHLKEAKETQKEEQKRIPMAMGCLCKPMVIQRA